VLKRKRWRVGSGLQDRGVFGGYPRDGNVSRLACVRVVLCFSVLSSICRSGVVLDRGISNEKFKVWNPRCEIRGMGWLCVERKDVAHLRRLRVFRNRSPAYARG